MDSNLVVGNGIDLSPHLKKMYFTDIINRAIFVYDFDLIKGSITNKKIFIKIQYSDEYPDGMIVDTNGFVWSAHWDGWRAT